MLLIASEASADRISLLGFEGDSARALRWRVAAALKRAGHTVIGSTPPKDPDNLAQLRAFAKRRRVDVFVAGSSVQGNDGWELSLSFKDAEGEAVGRGLAFDAENMRGLIRELKEEGPERLDAALKGGGGSRSGGDVDADAGDFAGKERARPEKGRGPEAFARGRGAHRRRRGGGRGRSGRKGARRAPPRGRRVGRDHLRCGRGRGGRGRRCRRDARRTQGIGAQLVGLGYRARRQCARRHRGRRG